MNFRNVKCHCKKISFEARLRFFWDCGTAAFSRPRPLLKKLYNKDLISESTMDIKPDLDIKEETKEYAEEQVDDFQDYEESDEE